VGRCIRYTVLVVLGVIAIGITLYWSSPHRARVGQTYTLAGSCYAAVPLAQDVATAAEIQQLDPSFRWVRVQRLVDTDRAVTVGYRDRVKVTELAIFSDTAFARVLVLDGENAGKAGWVPETLLRR